MTKRASAQGASDYPIPSTASDAYSPIREGFEVPIEPRDGLKGPQQSVDPGAARLEAERRHRWPTAPAFIRDTDLRANSRTYWFDEDSFGVDQPRALATGGWLAYQSGYLADFLQLRGALYTSQPLYANAFAGDTEMLSPDGDGLTTLGQANGRIKLAGQEITAGRLLVRTPYINPFDIRMIPLTFEGVVLTPEDRGPDQAFDYIASYLTRYKPRNETGFIPFSEGLGVTQDEGVLITGASYHASRWNIGFSNYWIKDALNTAYGEIDHMLPLGPGGEGPSFRVGINALDQRTVGADLIAGAPYDTYQASARLIASYAGFVFTLASSQTSDAASIQQPFGFGTSYTSMILTDFQQAGVRAAMLSLSYDFGRIGLEGVKVLVAWGRGEGTGSAANGSYAEQEERDFRVVYEPQSGRLAGLRLELEYIDWQVPGLGLPSEDLDQFRAIANYKVPLL
ncbi:MAG: OprD family outer membrane porin [Methyloceanibacter sp.]